MIRSMLATINSSAHIIACFSVFLAFVFTDNTQSLIVLSIDSFILDMQSTLIECNFESIVLNHNSDIQSL